MYAGFTTVLMQPDKAQEANNLYANSIMPAARQQQGNRGAWLVLDRATGKGVAISLWDTMADLEAGEAIGYYQQQVSQFGPLMTAPPVREVVVQG